MTPIPAITLLDLVLRGGLVACLVLLAGLLLRASPQTLVARLGALLAVGLAAYVGVNAPGVVQFPRSAWQAPWLALAAGNPVVFWWFCRALFEDGWRWRFAHGLPWLVMVVLALLQCLWLGPARAPQAVWLGRLLDALPLLFALLALRTAGATWRDDLVKRRRQLRWFIVLAGLLYTGVELAGQLWLAPSAPAGTRDVALLAGIVALLAWRLLAVQTSDVFGPAAAALDTPVALPAAPPATALATAPQGPQAPNLDTQLATDLHTLMAEARIYREYQLTIGGLAARLGVPEYRLRRLINQRLGHRNFNAFVNRWLLDDAQQALLDPLRAQLPVLSIALDAGFQSIGPFNRAFKAHTGLTPTDFRRQAAARPQPAASLTWPNPEIGWPGLAMRPDSAVASDHAAAWWWRGAAAQKGLVMQQDRATPGCMRSAWQQQQRRRWGLVAAGLTLASGALALGSLGGCAASAEPSSWPSVARALRIASAATSHTLCVSTFISGLDPNQVWQHEVRPEPGMGLVAWALDWQVDSQRREMRTTLAGRVASRAVFRPGEGCLLVPGETNPPLSPPAELALPALPPDPASDTLLPAPAGPLQDAVAAAFDENPQPPLKHTQAVVVLHRGRLVAEQYAPGVGIHSALSGHSISKSVAHAMVGVLVQQGRLHADQPAVPAWQQPGDVRAAITVDHLLRMASGLPPDETSGGWDAATRMWFDEPDMAGFAMQAQPEAPPMTAWHYSNRSTLLLSRLVRDAAGGNAAALRQWAAAGLFQPLGMRDVTVRLDATGTPVLSSDVYASARDWARFGQLYLDDGWAGGRQILPAGWVQRARTPTLGTGYGAGFWLNTTEARNAWGGRWGLPGAPTDAFFGRGHLGQYVVVVPSRQLVVVRLGWSHRPDGEITSVGRLVAGVVRWVDSGAGAAAVAAAP